MKRVLFLISNKNQSYTFLFNIFSKYKKTNIEEYSMYDGYSYFEGNYFIKNINLQFSFEYKSNIIDILIGDSDNLTNFYKNKNKYDDIVLFDSKYDFGIEKQKNLYRTIFLTIDEIPSPLENIEFLIETDSLKLISSANINIDKKYLYGYFYEYKLSFLFYYYLLGFYHLPLTYIDVNKKNLLGFYHKTNYKNERDVIVNNIYDLFKNKNNNLIKNYSLQYGNDFTTLIDLKYYKGWEKNHITSYVDYINSICILIFESDGPNGVNHPTEKIVKGLLFSKLNIPSILYCNDDLMIKLYKDNFWFLNFEFINFDKFENLNIDEKICVIDDSITKSVKFILNLFEENSNDLKKTNQSIVKMFSNKMQNNYKIFNETIEDIKIQDDIMDFILETPTKNLI